MSHPYPTNAERRRAIDGDCEESCTQHQPLRELPHAIAALAQK